MVAVKFGFKVSAVYNSITIPFTFLYSFPHLFSIITQLLVCVFLNWGSLNNVAKNGLQSNIVLFGQAKLQNTKHDISTKSPVTFQTFNTDFSLSLVSRR